MIPAAKASWFEALFVRFARFKIEQTFDSLRVRGAHDARALAAAAPLLVVSNHTAWWDPLLALVVTRYLLGVDGYAMMDSSNLRAHPYFRKVGAFGVDRTDPRDGARSIRYAVRLLDRPARMVWIFAQGRLVTVTARPLVFLPGSAEVARLARGASVLPAAFRYEHGEAMRPTIWLSFGAALAAERDAVVGRRAQEDAVARELDRIDAAIAGDGADDFERWLRGRRPSIFGTASRALAILTASSRGDHGAPSRSSTNVPLDNEKRT